MLKTGDIIYKVTLEGYDIPCVVVKKYKVGQHLSKIDGTESGGYLLKRAVRADQYLLKNAGFFVAVKVRDDATNEDIEKAINVAYLDDDCEVLEQRLHEITNIKVEEK